MRLSFLVLLFVCYSLLFATTGYAQSPHHFNMMKDDISTMIPPLPVLIDSAIINNPGLKSSDLQVIINRNTLQVSRNYWTRNLSFLADIRYGNFNYYTSDNSANTNVATSRSEFRYGVGGSIKFPINDLLDRKNQIRVAKAEIDLAQSVAEEKQVELRKIVITQYNDLILKQRLVKLSSKNIETLKINSQMVEKDFMNGVIAITEYARVMGIISGAEAEYENARMNFLTAYMILEEIVGFKFNLVNTLPETNEPH